MDGWRIIQGNETGTTQMNEYYSTFSECGQENVYTSDYFVSWTDPSGNLHPFNTTWYINSGPSDCYTPSPENSGGNALDSSGYSMTISGYDDGSEFNVSVFDKNGIQVYPQVTDQFGNYWS